MKKFFGLLGGLALAAIVPICAAAEAPAPAEKAQALESQKEKNSYVIGLSFGRDIKRIGLEVELDALFRGMKDAMGGGKLLLSEEEVQKTMQDLQREMMAKQMQRVKELAEKNKKQGEEFLAENKKKEGVVALPSGLQYKVVKEGAGKVPTINDVVTVNYRGILIDGTEFDSSGRHGGPPSLAVSGLVKGWVEALQMMKVGSKWMLFVPPSLAYGERGSGPDIGPNQTLIFELELLGVQAAPKEPPRPK